MVADKPVIRGRMQNPGAVDKVSAAMVRLAVTGRPAGGVAITSSACVFTPFASSAHQGSMAR